MTKKLSLLFLICILSVLNINAEVVEGLCGDNVNYSLDTSTGLLSITGTGAMTSAPWYSNRSYIKIVEISDGVTSIGNYAFRECSGLTSIEIPNSVTSIGEGAFWVCSGLTSVTIGNSVTSIGSEAFQYCSGLTSIEIPNSVTSIGNYAFEYCSGLTSVTIGNSVTSIGESAFSGCSGLTSIHITDIAAWCKISFFSSYSNPLRYAKHLFMDGKEIIDLVIPNSVTSIGESAFNGCSGLTSVTIPNSVKSIGNYAFDGCSGLTSVTIGNSVTSIGESAFQGCSGLTSVTIPNSVTSIGDWAFNGCSGLTSVTIPNSVTSIGNSAFMFCSGLTSITIPNSVTSIGNYAFYGCSGLTSITIPNSVTSIGNYAFSGCYFEKKNFINNSSLNAEANNYWGATIVDSRNDGFVIKDGTLLKYIGNDASVIIPNSVTSIGESAFNGCSGLTSVTIPNSVTSIGESAFYLCSGLTSVTIPNSVTSIGERAFYLCSGLSSVISEIEEPFAFGTNAFDNISSNCVLAVPYGTKDAYIAKGWTTSVFKGGIKEMTYIVDGIYYGFNSNNKQATVTAGENKYSGNVIIPSSVTFNDTEYSVTSIGEGAFDGCSGLTSVTIPNSVTSIGQSAFRGCSGLTSVTIPNSVTSIGGYAFQSCSGLTSITIPNSVTSIGSNAFYLCSGLTKVTLNSNAIASKSYSPSSTLGRIFGSQVKEYVLGDDVTSIGRYAFRGCSGLTSVTIPNSVTSIGSSAFQNCSGLTQVTLNNNDIASKSYSSSSTIGSIFGSQVKEYILGDDVTSIGSYAFSGCSGLTSITIPNSVTSIGEDAFSGCSGLTEVYCNAENIPTTSSNAFQNVNLTNATLIVPESSVAAYKATSPWSGFGSIVALALRGDANGDGKVDIDDATFVTNIILGTEEATEAADVNNDGTVNMPDAMFIVNKILNGKFPDE